VYKLKDFRAKNNLDLLPGKVKARLRDNVTNYKSDRYCYRYSSFQFYGMF